jgi:membrane protease YdiL (CAAX protease family)
MNLGMFPIAPMLLALFIPITYCLRWKMESLRKVMSISICCLFIVFLYRITVDLSNIIEPTLGYFIGKSIIFIILPLITILYIERCKIKTALTEIGVKKDKLVKSILLGLGFLIITVILALIIYSWGKTEPSSAYWNTVMFFEAFNEEFLFRGVLFIYLWKITDLKVAYVTSILAFILAHPQHLTSLSLICVATQGILLGAVAYKTKNIIGPWISHGFNRIIPQILMATVFQLI